MSKWIAAGEPPDSLKISLVIKKINNPDLVDWLHNLPYGKASVLIREILDSVVKTGKFSGFSGGLPVSTVSRPPPPVVGKDPANVTLQALPFVQVPAKASAPVDTSISQKLTLAPEVKLAGSPAIDAATLRKCKEFGDMC